MREFIPHTLFGLVCAVALVAGLYTVGSPQSARIFASDAEIVRDIRSSRVADVVHCFAQAADNKLPEHIDVNADCDGKNIADAFEPKITPPGGQRVTYERLSIKSTGSGEFRICANLNEIEIWQARAGDYERRGISVVMETNMVCHDRSFKS